MAHLDFKITMWKRIHIPDDKVQEVIEELKNGSCDAPYDLLEKEGFYFDQAGPDEECEEPMLVEENEGSSTQELWDSTGNIIYQNGAEPN